MRKDTGTCAPRVFHESSGVMSAALAGAGDAPLASYLASHCNAMGGAGGVEEKDVRYQLTRTSKQQLAQQHQQQQQQQQQRQRQQPAAAAAASGRL